MAMVNMVIAFLRYFRLSLFSLVYLHVILQPSDLA